MVLKDFILDPTGRFDERAAFFGITMLLYTQGGAVYSHREVEHGLTQAGFEPPRAVALDTFELLIAKAKAR